MISLDDNAVNEDDKEALLSILYGKVTKVFHDIYITCDYKNLVSVYTGEIIMSDRFYSKIMFQYFNITTDNYMLVNTDSCLKLFDKHGKLILSRYNNSKNIKSYKMEETDEYLIVHRHDTEIEETITIDKATNRIMSDRRK